MSPRSATLLLLVTAGCAVPGGDGALPRTLDEARAAAEAQADAVDQSVTSATPVEAPDRTTASSPGPERTDAPAASATTPGPAGDDTPSSPAPAPAPPPPTEHPFAFAAELSATCVRHGEQVTIEVRTEPDASVAYHAVYAGEEGGAVPPFGEGHGGNGGDPADARGRYADTWVVGPDAPVGPARVDVVAAWFGEMTRTELAFEVADRTTGVCGGTP
ncbi:MAG: hypothetical protein ACLGIR_05020 [Actinomycetes bacterium]